MVTPTQPFSLELSAPFRRPKSRVRLAWAAWALVACSTAVQAQDVAGVVKTQRGGVQIVRNGQNLPVTVGTTLQAGDLIRTSGDAAIGLTLKDDTRVALGPNSQVALDRFAFDANTHQGNMFVSVLKGTLSMVSGLMAKLNPEQVQIRTPTATVGIRGTEFIIDVP